MGTHIAGYVRAEQKVADAECGTHCLWKGRMAREMFFVYLIMAKLHFPTLSNHHDLK